MVDSEKEKDGANPIRSSGPGPSLDALGPPVSVPVDASALQRSMVPQLPSDVLGRIAQYVVGPVLVCEGPGAGAGAESRFRRDVNARDRGDGEGGRSEHEHEREREHEYGYNHEEYEYEYEYDYTTLARAARVSRAFHLAAARLLYERVVLHFPDPDSDVDYGGDPDGERDVVFPRRSNVKSARLPQYAPYVVSLVLSGTTTTTTAHNQHSSSTLALAPALALALELKACIRPFPNLRRVHLTPRRFAPELIDAGVRALRGCRVGLEVLGVEASFAGGVGGGEAEPGGGGPFGLGGIVEEEEEEEEERQQEGGADAEEEEDTDLDVDVVDILVGTAHDAQGGSVRAVDTTRLKLLELRNPGRRILQALPVWLERLAPPLGKLTELHLTDNCGSVTPGVLKAVTPQLARSLKALTLGLSYSLKDQDVFEFISSLKALEWLELTYHWQLRPPRFLPTLPALRAFTVSHVATTSTETRVDVDKLDKWIRWVVGGSGCGLRVLRVKGDGDGDGTHSARTRGPSVSHDGLVDHVVSVHARTLRVLDLLNDPSLGRRGGSGGGAGMCIRKKKMAVLLRGCAARLEELRVRVSEGAFMLFAEHPYDLTKLRFAVFEICNAPRSQRPRSSSKSKSNSSQTRPNRIFAGGGSESEIDALATSILQKYRPSLRKLAINGVVWEAQWVPPEPDNYEGAGDGEGGRVVAKRVEVLVPPWDTHERSS